MIAEISVKLLPMIKQPNPITEIPKKKKKRRISIKLKKYPLTQNSQKWWRTQNLEYKFH